MQFVVPFVIMAIAYTKVITIQLILVSQDDFSVYICRDVKVREKEDKRKSDAWKLSTS